MVVIRLARSGSKKRPFYRITVADRRAKRDGRFIEYVGFFNPIATGGEQRLRVDMTRVDYWRSQGAKPSPRVQKLLDEWVRLGPESGSEPEAASASGEAA